MGGYSSSQDYSNYHDADNYWQNYSAWQSYYSNPSNPPSNPTFNHSFQSNVQQVPLDSHATDDLELIGELKTHKNTRSSKIIWLLRLQKRAVRVIFDIKGSRIFKSIFRNNNLLTLPSIFILEPV